MSDKKIKIKKGRTVLIVDDDKFLSDMYTVKFKESDFNVVSASGSIEALEKLKEDPEPDVVLLDLVMPTMDGFEFLQKAKSEKLTKTAKFIILSNLGQDSDIKKGKQTIEFTPTETGVISWSCWMGMIPGTFIVTEDGTATTSQIAEATTQTASAGGSCGGGDTCGQAGSCGGGCGGGCGG